MLSFIKKKFLKKNAKIKHAKDRTYSLEDYDDTYKIISRVLRLMGLHLNCHDSDTVRFWFDFFYWFEFVNIFIAFVLEGIEVMRTAKGGSFENAIMIFRMLPCMGYLLMAMLKSYKIVYYRSVYDNLITELRNMWPQDTVSAEEDQILSKALSRLNTVNTGFYWCNWFLVMSFILPYSIDLIKRAFDHDVPKYLPFFYWLPFDPLQPVVYEILLMFQMWHTLITVWFMLCGDLLFCFFINHITTQFDLLSVRINILIPVPVDEQLIEGYPLANNHKNANGLMQIPEVINERDTEVIHQELCEIVVRHRVLIRLSGDVETLFSFALFINFFNSSIVICFCTFCSFMVENWYDFTYKTFLTTALCQTWLICWFGQILLDSSGRVNGALYNCGWYMASQKIKKSIQIMIQRSQKSVYVTTYGFTIICLASYTTILKTSWSYFTLLLNTYKK